MLLTSVPFAAGEGRRGGHVRDSEEEIVVSVLTNKASALSLPFLLPYPNTSICFKDHLVSSQETGSVFWSGGISPPQSTAFVPPHALPPAEVQRPPRVQLELLSDLAFPESSAGLCAPTRGPSSLSCTGNVRRGVLFRASPPFSTCSILCCSVSYTL